MTETIEDYPNSVSIIIPVFNECSTIANVINEILDFTFKYKKITWEVIVIDDGSTDNSLGIIKKYKYYKNITY